MNLLIVDDEPLEVTIIEGMIDKKKFDIEEIYIAYSMKQAMEVLESHEVSILLSDIQMPKGSGHELVQWSLDHELHITSIFLTSHALFDYAKEAIRLNVRGYLLKPVTKEELERSLVAAVEQVREQYQMEQNKKHASYWNSSKILLRQEYWRKILFEVENVSVHLLADSFEKYGVFYEDSKKIVPILISWKRKKDKGSTWNDSTIEFVLKNVVSEVLWGNTDIGNIIFEQEKMIVLYDLKQEMESYLFSKCEIMLQRLFEVLNFCDINVYVNQSAELQGLKLAAEELFEVEKYDIQKQNRVVAIKERNENEFSYEKPDMKLWVSEIFSSHYNRSLKEISNYLNKIKKSNQQGQGMLNQFQHDFLQELYIALEQKGIQANSIFKEERMVDLFNDAIKSVSDMENWMEELIQFLVSFNYQAEKTPTIIEEIKFHIVKNLDGELSRNELASIVYLHPDYLSHIFKKQTGMSISDYIIEERLKKARIMLTSTSRPISEIAMHIGYPNTAYFTKLFKRATKMTPKEYRNLKES